MNFGVSLHLQNTRLHCETFLGDYRLLSPVSVCVAYFFFDRPFFLFFSFLFFGNNLWRFELLLFMNSVPKHFKVIIFGGIFLVFFVRKGAAERKKNCVRMHKFWAYGCVVNFIVCILPNCNGKNRLEIHTNYRGWHFFGFLSLSSICVWWSIFQLS